jgi:hypothetical protein
MKTRGGIYDPALLYLKFLASGIGLKSFDFTGNSALGLSWFAGLNFFNNILPLKQSLTITWITPDSFCT